LRLKRIVKIKNNGGYSQEFLLIFSAPHPDRRGRRWYKGATGHA
jgi:hypothetical protein